MKNKKPTITAAVILTLSSTSQAQTVLAAWEMNAGTPTLEATADASCITADDLNWSSFPTNYSRQDDAVTGAPSSSMCFSGWTNELNWDNSISFKVTFTSLVDIGTVSGFSFYIRNYDNAVSEPNDPTQFMVRVIVDGVPSTAGYFVSDPGDITSAWQQYTIGGGGSTNSFYPSSGANILTGFSGSSFEFQITAFNTADGESDSPTSRKIGLDSVRVLGNVTKLPEPNTSAFLFLGAVSFLFYRHKK